MKIKLLIVGLIAVLTGCAAIGPADEALLSKAVLSAVPKDDGGLRMYGQATWMPNAKGFTPYRNLVGTQSISGVLILTDASVLFQEWDEAENKFSIVKKIPLNEIRTLSLDEFGINRAIVVQDLRYQYDSFIFTRAAGGLAAPGKTEEGYKLLSGMIKK